MKRFLTLKSRDMIIVGSIGMFVVQLDASVLVIALPTIARDFGRPVVSMSIAISIYLTMMVALLPVSGWAADRFGAKRVFLLSTAAFAASSLACALASSFWPFIAVRAVQGFMAGLMLPVGRLLLLRATPKDELVDALSITTMPMLIAPTFGPSIGGFIVDYLSWHYIFLLNLPMAAILLVITRARVPDAPGDRELPLDWRGAILLSGSLIAVLTGFDRLVSGFRTPGPWLLLLAGVTMGTAVLRHLRRTPAPIVDLAAMASRAFRTASFGAGAIVRLPGRALSFALPLMFQVGFGLPPFAAGLLLIALSGGDLVTKPWVSPMFDRLGYRTAVVAFSLLGLVAMTAFVLVQPGPLLVPLLALLLFVCGISRSIVFTGITSLAFATLGKSTMTSGNVVSSIAMQLFNALGISLTAALLGMFAQIGGREQAALFDYRCALAVMVAIGLAATIALIRWLPQNLDEVHPHDAE